MEATSKRLKPRRIAWVMSIMVALVTVSPLLATVQGSSIAITDDAPHATPIVVSGPDPDNQVSSGEPNAGVTPESLPNTDTLVLPEPDDHPALHAGQHREYLFTYQVTASRASTTIASELRFGDGTIADGWLLESLDEQGEWFGDSPTIKVVDDDSTDPGTAIDLHLRVTAPIDPISEQTALLFIASDILTEQGTTGTGLDAQEPEAAVTVVPVPATPDAVPPDDGTDSNAEVSATPIANLETSGGSDATLPKTVDAGELADLIGSIGEAPGDGTAGAGYENLPAIACDAETPGEAVPGGHADLRCIHTLSIDSDSAVTASFIEMDGEGWLLAIGEVSEGETRWSAPGETASWQPGRIPGDALVIDLAIRVFVPAAAEPAHRATVAISTDKTSQPTSTWQVGVSDVQPMALASSACTPDISIISQPLAWRTPYAVNEQTLVGEFAYQVTTLDQCEWSVTLSATGLEYSGTQGGTRISPVRIRFESSRLVAGHGVSEVQTSEALGRPRELLSADANAPAGTVEHGLTISVTLPAGAAPGHYRSTLTVTISEDGDPGG